jgi:hypothetical protein
MANPAWPNNLKKTDFAVTLLNIHPQPDSQ